MLAAFVEDKHLSVEKIARLKSILSQAEVAVKINNERA
jgi:hypothetical protein